jgi:hypothetical protein
MAARLKIVLTDELKLPAREPRILDAELPT